EQPIERRGGKNEFDAVFKMGLRITGKVLDAASSKPVAGAVVSPAMFFPPSYLPDLERSVITDGKGSFEIRGVHSLFSIEHPDYVTQEIYLNHEKPATSQVIKLV